MWIELPTLGIVVANIVAIPSIHLGVSWLFTRLPRAWFRPDRRPFRPGRWESPIFERVLAVRRWKSWLPDAAPWFGGFPKATLRSRDSAYLAAFQAETCRGEAAHLAQTGALLLCLGWNPWPVAASVIIAYAFLANLPCVIVQRHTRRRIGRLLAVAAGTQRRRNGG